MPEADGTRERARQPSPASDDDDRKHSQVSYPLCAPDVVIEKLRQQHEELRRRKEKRRLKLEIELLMEEEAEEEAKDAQRGADAPPSKRAARSAESDSSGAERPMPPPRGGERSGRPEAPTVNAVKSEKERTRTGESVRSRIASDKRAAGPPPVKRSFTEKMAQNRHAAVEVAAMSRAPKATEFRAQGAEGQRMKNEDIPEYAVVEESDEAVEEFSGLRLKSRLVSIPEMRSRMARRRFVSLRHIIENMHGDDIPGDWVTIGVLATKSSPKTSRSGSKYCVFQLNDLRGGAINVFAFAETFETVWKELVGSVVAMLNPRIVPSTETLQKIGLDVERPDKWMKIGTSMDLKFCKGVTNGTKCSAVLGGRNDEYCDAHAVQIYKKSKLHRQELMTGNYGFNVGDPQREKAKKAANRNSVNGTYVVGGTTVSTEGKTTKTLDPCENALRGKGRNPLEANRYEKLMGDTSKGGRMMRAAKALVDGKKVSATPKPNIFGATAMSRMGFDPVSGRDFVQPNPETSKPKPSHPGQRAPARESKSASTSARPRSGRNPGAPAVASKLPDSDSDADFELEIEDDGAGARAVAMALCREGEEANTRRWLAAWAALATRALVAAQTLVPTSRAFNALVAGQTSIVAIEGQAGSGITNISTTANAIAKASFNSSVTTCQMSNQSVALQPIVSQDPAIAIFLYSDGLACTADVHGMVMFCTGGSVEETGARRAARNDLIAERAPSALTSKFFPSPASLGPTQVISAVAGMDLTTFKWSGAEIPLPPDYTPRTTLDGIIGLNDLWAVELTLGTTSPIEPVPATGTLPPPRYHACAAALGNNSILVHGGIGAELLLLDDTYIFDATTLTWTNVTATAGSPGIWTGAACATVNGNACLFWSRGLHYNDVWQFSAAPAGCTYGSLTSVRKWLIQTGELNDVRGCLKGLGAALVAHRSALAGGPVDWSSGLLLLRYRRKPMVLILANGADLRADPSTSTMTPNSTMPSPTTTSATSTSGGVATGFVVVAAAIIVTIYFLRRKPPVTRSVPTEIQVDPPVAPGRDDILQRHRALEEQLGTALPPAPPPEYDGFVEPLGRPAEPIFTPKSTMKLLLISYHPLSPFLSPKQRDNLANEIYAEGLIFALPETVCRALCDYVTNRADEIHVTRLSSGSSRAAVVKAATEIERDRRQQRTSNPAFCPHAPSHTKIVGTEGVLAENLTDGTEGVVPLSVIDVGKRFVAGSGPAMDS
ncbi:hypothetical protein BDK51DRAFT_46010 [Blyttiomyces helicus]|uniref:MCM10 OB-fold domain-containing protein n=1 Tax=Blyttiomyces helicus TaxID=388810 RepID=A0A4P9WFH6_9FUNG|nr:hypothetical protein BDK51DRAFT_46010 [Blyttiomyces helicus]|eukprot:RKO91162.1 hypothetical protein BDK51DRAFT_46010 [Blyttiomyces helicus]